MDAATKALRAPDKHMLDGRKLRLEYASEEATKKATPWVFRQERKDAEAASNPDANEQVQEAPKADEKEIKTNEKEKEERIARKLERETKRKSGPAREGRSNATSGAILANVQRQKITAQPFQGKKITFD